MDSDQLISVVVGLAFFLFYTLKNSGKKNAGNKRGTAKTGVPPSAKKVSLQERLEAALHEMQQRVEGGASPAGTGRESSLEESFTEARGSEFDPTWAAVKEKDFSSPLDGATPRLDVMEEAEDSLSLSTFKQAHGLHYAEDGDPYLKEHAGTPEFHEAHGLHYGRSAQRPASDSNQGSGAGALHDMLQNTDEIRRAVILAEVLGKPKALRV